MGCGRDCARQRRLRDDGLGSPEKKIEIEPSLIASHLRRYLDSLELISLTIESVAVHAGSHISAAEAVQFAEDLNDLWNQAYLYQLSPVAVLEFITNHIAYDALRTIYKVLLKNYHIGRSIPGLINNGKNFYNRRIHRQCKEAVNALAEGGCQAVCKTGGRDVSNDASADYRGM